MYRTFLILLLFISCSQNISKKSTNTFVKFLAREQYMKEQDPDRTFNPNPAILISTLPDKLGNMNADNNINDFEIVNNGLGYSKRYKNKKINNGYWADIIIYHKKFEKIPINIDNYVVKNVYDNEKKQILSLYNNSKILEENVLIFTVPSGKLLKMYETQFSYLTAENQEVISYMYFGTSLDSFYKIRITYNKDYNYLFEDKEYFIKDFAYYYTEEMSLQDFIKYKKSNNLNPIKVQKIKIK